MESGVVIIGTEIETKSFDKQIEELERELRNIEEELSDPKKYKLDSRSIEEYQVKAEKLKNSIIGLQKQQLKLNENNFFSKAKNDISSLIKKTLKWGVALFGIRSAYSFISKSMNTLSQYNQQIGTDLSYMQFAMATALEPVIETIIQLAYKLLGIINSVSMALFNVNLFANASAERFKSMSKSANQIKKSLAGFDEMNIIQDNSASGAGSAGAGSPSVDLSMLTDTEAGEEFKSFWEDVIKFWEEDWEEAFDSINGNWSSFMYGLGLTGKGFYDIFKGIIDIFIGLWDMLVALFTGDAEKLKKGWDTFVKGLKEIVVGLVEGIIGLTLMLLGAILGILLDLAQGIWEQVIKPIGKFFADLWGKIVDGAKLAWNGVKNAFGSVVSFFSGIISKISNFFYNIGVKAGQVVSGAFKTVVNGVLKTIESVLNTPIKSINKLINVINKVPGINLGTLNTIQLPRLAKGGIVNMPSKGVSLGNAIVGERGQEGVIPLTDSQQMALLGEAIGKYITINATITNSMNGRVISRELQKIQNEDNFGFNR